MEAENWEFWLEGGGKHSSAFLFGKLPKEDAETWEKAIHMYKKEGASIGWKDILFLDSIESWTWCERRVFDNEKDAKERFG